MTKEEFISAFTNQQKIEMADALLADMFDNAFGKRKRIVPACRIEDLDAVDDMFHTMTTYRHK